MGKVIFITRSGIQANKLLLKFEQDYELDELCAKIPGAIYSHREEGWHMENVNDALPQLFEIFKGRAWLNYTGLLNRQADKKANEKNEVIPITEPLPDLRPEVIQELKEFTNQLKLSRFSPRTIKSYESNLNLFFRYFPSKLPSQITENDINTFNLKFIVERNCTVSYQRQFMSAIKKFYGNTLYLNINFDRLTRAKGKKTLPTVLNKDEIKQLLDCTENIKHKCFFTLMYSTGMRVGEVINLKLEDIDYERKVIHVREGKGGKDRIVGLSEHLEPILLAYLEKFKPEIYVFNSGKEKGKKYAARSIQQVYQDSVAKAGIKKRVRTHTLRHSFGTHLMESGTHLRYIQTLLGHASPKTTMIYTHVSKSAAAQVKSPLDDLFKGNK